MYISKLVLHGFKSFGQRTSMNFGEGITGVVGPNGCGKTNIVDALRWVLGEQKQSILRSSRMEEVIFHGSRSHKPTSFSEVTLAIHNNKSTLPLEYTDIEISRRLYRDGESEFLINRNPCRLKDIMDLFMDTGMGSDAYSVIELKMIEAILSEGEDDRRRMFEEAAGINKYKKQRRSAHRKLEATSQDLERVNDIIAEVDSQVHALRLQLKRFERHKRLSADLKDRELRLARWQLQELAREMAPLQEVLASGRDSHEAEAALIAEEEKRLAQLRTSFDQREAELQGGRDSLAEATERLNNMKEKQLVWGEQLRSTRQALERFEQEQASEVKRGEGYQEEITQLEAQLKALGPKLEQAQTAYETRRSEEEAVTGAYQKEEQHLQTVRERKFNQRHLIQEEEARRQRTTELIQEKRAEKERLEADVSQRAGSLATLEERKAELNQTGKELETRLAEIAHEQEKAAEQLQDMETRESRLREEHQALTTRMQVLQSRQEIFANLVESHEGYPGGTRAVLSASDGFPGLLGTVADLVEVKPPYTQAVETALGTFATCLVTETLEQAERILAYAEEHDLGRLSVIPLERVDDVKEPQPEPGAAPGTPLVELITTKGMLAGLYHRLLAGFYWADESPGDDLPAGVNVITAEGHLLGAVPYLTHLGAGDADGESGKAGSAIVGRAGELERLKQIITQTDTAAEELQARLTELGQERSRLADLRRKFESEAESLMGRVNEVNRELSQLDYELQRSNEDLTELKSWIPVLGEDIQGLEESLTAHDRVLVHLQEQGAQLEGEISRAEAAYNEVREKRDAWQAGVQELRVQLLTMESQRENLAGRKLYLEDTQSASRQRLEQLKTDSEQARTTIDQLSRDLEGAAQGRAALEKGVDEQRAASDSKEAAVREVREQVSRLEEQIRARQHGREETLSWHQELDLKLSDLRKSEELIRARIQEVYHEELAEGEEDEQQEDEQVLRIEIEKIQATLERIGPINMAVAEEYAEESKRLDFLTEQRDDLLAAEESLGETIRRIDSQAREQFRETYDQIRHHFKHTFRLFFEGGEGDLRMVGDPDPLEGDIEIIAQPPGKKTRSLRALSGGEKALTAIALLFAIYMVKPSPFCILDEVDAPLDDSNIGKFTNVIKQFAKDTQFIIVTHNKLTMESADYLYGVTMAEEGLSNLVSVDLGEYES